MMDKIKVVYFGLILLLVGGCEIKGKEANDVAVEDNPEVQVLKGNCEFSRNLYETLANSSLQNIVFSPISVHSVLSMIYQGSGGETKLWLADVLRVPDRETTALGYKNVLQRLNSTTNATLLLVDKLFIKKKFELQEKFKKTISDDFLSEVESIDFEQSATAAKIINEWVSDNTGDKIKDLVDANDLKKTTRLILINAIYFKGDWQSPFNPSKTVKALFHLNGTDSVETKFMFQTNSYWYTENAVLNAQIIELPYVNPDLCLFVILPKDKDGITELERKFVEESTIENITSNLEWTKIDLTFPKFKIEQTIDLKEHLKKIGLGLLFDEDKADFSETITAPIPLAVDNVIQKAFIEINEQGSEAAVATFVEVMETRVLDMTPKVEFKANHPFLYILMDRKVAKNPLFIGRFANPY